MLAAGASVRLGRPKQLLLYDGESLIRHGFGVATGAGAKSMMAVLGAHSDLIMKEIAGNNIPLIINPQWKEGMASSIRCGLSKLLEDAPNLDAVIIMVCDQPFVTTKLLQSLVEKYQLTRKPVIASCYQNNLGTPALFDKTIFAALLSLKGDTGAKKIMKENPGWVDFVNFPLGNIDIDTEEDYESLPRSSEGEVGRENED